MDEQTDSGLDLILLAIPKGRSRALVKAIEAAIRGGAPLMVLSDRQRRIAELMAQGLPNKAIARTLGIAPSTVKNQLTGVFELLRVSNRTQAAMALRALYAAPANMRFRPAFFAA